MGHNQKLFTVKGYSFLRADQIDSILQDIMTTDWCSQWIPKQMLAINMQMRPNVPKVWKGLDGLGAMGSITPMKREITFSLSLDKQIQPECVKEIISAFSEQFSTRMKKILHGVKSDPPGPFITHALKKTIKTRPELHDKPPELKLTTLAQTQASEWERYAVKAWVRSPKSKRR